MAAGDVIPAVDPYVSDEDQRPLSHPARALGSVPENDGPGPLGNLGASVSAVLGAAGAQSGQSGGHSPHLSSEQFGPGLEAPAGAAEAGAAEPAAGGLADLAVVAAL
jgi:hypothetical protein